MNMPNLQEMPAKRTGYFAVKVRTRGETNVSHALRLKGFDVLAPMCAQSSPSTHRARKADSALFPGYVFVKLDPRELLPLVTTCGVSYVVRHGKTLEPLPLEEELTVQTLCEAGTDFEPFNQYVAGQVVCIKSGPLKDRQGTLVRVGDKDRLVISLSSIFSSVCVDLRDTVVEIYG